MPTLTAIAPDSPGLKLVRQLRACRVTLVNPGTSFSREVRHQSGLASEQRAFGRNLGFQVEAETFFTGASAATSRSCPKPRVGARGLDSCLGASIHDQENQVAGASHIFFPSLRLCVLTDAMNAFADMFARADALGGSSYRLTIFNLFGGWRLPEVTEGMADGIESLLVSPHYESKISAIEVRHEHNFIIDSRTGSIYTGREPAC
jgi:hypothetical protein